MKKYFFSINIVLILLCVATVNTIHDEENTVELPNKTGSFPTTVSLNQILVVKIRGNPTTGYGWYLENADTLDRSILNPTNLNEYNSCKDYITDNHPQGYVGVGGYYYFKFKPLKETNSITLIFNNKRPWENKAVRTVELLVTVVNK
jgi:predicted secreted protein